MSFALPYINTVVDKYPPYNQNFQYHEQTHILPSIWQIIKKYDSFKEIVQIALMKDILEDSQAKMTIFVPTDFLLPKMTLKTCIGDNIQEKDKLAINFEVARTMVNSLIIPSSLTTTMMIQSAFTRYKTRDSVNTLTIETQHCVQFEPFTYNKPPFGIVINGISKILNPDQIASNGIVHTIDKFPSFY